MQTAITLPIAAANWVRLMRAVKSEILLQLALPGLLRTMPAKVAAVAEGCLVASTKPKTCSRMKLMA
jgi:hypothetical protein